MPTYSVELVDYPAIEATLNSLAFTSSSLKTTLNSVPDTTMFNLAVYNLAVAQEFLSDNGRMSFYASISDSFTIYILELVLGIYLLLTLKAKKLHLIKC
jgi:hypothetical protein